MSLDSQYFKRIYVDDSSQNFKYTAYRPLDSPMILFSKLTGTPLASLHLKTQNNSVQNNEKGNRGRALITKRPKLSKLKCDFQGIINMDNQEFEFIITNLSSVGYINFNIIRMNKDGNIDYKYVNEINQLRPLESYVVQCDQSDNGVLILRSITKETSDGKRVKVNVKDDEVLGDIKKASGSYFFLAVIPEAKHKDLVKLYEDTVWACSDLICVRTKKERQARLQRSDIWTGSGLSSRASGYAHHAEDDPTFYTGDFYNSSYAHHAEGISARSSGFYFNIHAEDDPISNDNTGEEKYYVTQVSDMGMGFFDDDGSSDENESNINSTEQLKNSNVIVNNTLESSIIDDSFVGRVETGRKITVNSVESDIIYDYDKVSTPCIIGLSISDKIVFMDNEENNEELSSLASLAKDMVNIFIKDEGKQLLESLQAIYKTDSCSICLEGVKENKPLDIVFYQCGHQCCHYECGKSLNKCPLCRKEISAQLRC